MEKASEDEEVLGSCGAQIVLDGTGVDVAGWQIRSLRKPILSEQGHEALVRWLSSGFTEDEHVSSCGSVLVGDTHMQLPEILFGNSVLELRHTGSGTVMRFDAGGGLRRWVELFVAGEYQVIKVPEAREWQVHQEQDASKLNLKHEQYDWTWATDYAGSTSFPDTSDDGDDAKGEEEDEAQPRPLCLGEPPPADMSAGWVPCEGGNIDWALLQDRTIPILFYAEVVLFEDFIHDHGAVQLSAKIRVMPQCWFVLLRYWARVDGVVMKVFDTRCFHRFGDVHVFRERTKMASTFHALRERGCATLPTHYPDAQKALPFLRPTEDCPSPTCEKLALADRGSQRGAALTSNP